MKAALASDARIALVNVPPPEVVQGGPGGADRPLYPHIGLAYLSAILKENGVDHLTIDAPFDGLCLDEMKKELLHFQPNIIGFTAMTHQIVHNAKIASELKNLFGESLFLIGGAHATVAPSLTLEQFSVFDIAVIGEGERTLMDIVRTMETGTEDISTVSGIAYRSGNNTKVTDPRPFIDDLDSIPFPDYGHVKHPINIYPIYSSRGCPFKCIFCCRISGNKLRVRSPRNVIDEIKYIREKYNSGIIDFADEQVTIPRNRIMEICELLIQERLNNQIRWTALSRVDSVDQELLDKMKEAGCMRIAFGVESGNQEILRRIKKGITVEDAEKAVAMAKKAGLKTDTFFILGHPYETVQMIHDTIRLATKLNADTVSFAIMVPYPGTVVHEMAVKGDGNYKLISDNWKDFDKQYGNALELIGLTRKELEKMQLEAYITFYVKNLRLIDMCRTAFFYRKLLWKMITRRFV